MRKKIIISILFIALVIGFLQIRNKDTPERIASDFIAAVYEADYVSIYKMFPKSFQKRAIEDTKNMWKLDTEQNAVKKLGETLISYNDTLHCLFGEEWNISYEIKDINYSTKEELERFNQQLQLMGVSYKAKKAAAIQTTIYFIGTNGVTGSTDLSIPAIYSGKWELGQYIEPTEITYQMFGDLMDGFSMIIDEGGEEEIEK